MLDGTADLLSAAFTVHVDLEDDRDGATAALSVLLLTITALLLSSFLRRQETEQHVKHSTPKAHQEQRTARREEEEEGLTSPIGVREEKTAGGEVRNVRDWEVEEARSDFGY